MKYFLIILLFFIVIVAIDTLIGYIDKRVTQIRKSGNDDSNILGVVGYGKKADELSQQLGNIGMVTFACEGKYDHEKYVKALKKIIEENNIEIIYTESVGAIAALDAISKLDKSSVKKIVLNSAPTSFDDVRFGNIINFLFIKRPSGPFSRWLLGLGANGDVIAGIQQLKESFEAISSYNIDAEITYIFGKNDPVINTKKASENWRQRISSIQIKEMDWTGHCPTSENRQKIAKLLGQWSVID